MPENRRCAVRYIRTLAGGLPTSSRLETVGECISRMIRSGTEDPPTAERGTEKWTPASKGMPKSSESVWAADNLGNVAKGGNYGDFNGTNI